MLFLGTHRALLKSTTPLGLRIILNAPFIAGLSRPVTCFGDSSTISLGGEANQPWPAQLRRWTSGFPVDNEGIVGQTLRQIVSRIVSSTCIRTSSVISGAGSVTLNGYLTSGGGVSLMPGRAPTPLQVAFTFAADETGQTFTVNGAGGSSLANVTNATWSAGTATLTTDVGHGLSSGQTMTVYGINTASLSTEFNGTVTTLTGTTGNTLVYALTGNPGNYSSGGQIYGPKSEVVPGGPAGTVFTTTAFIGIPAGGVTASGASAGAVAIGIPTVISQPGWGLTRAQQLAGYVFVEEGHNTFNNSAFRIYDGMVDAFAQAYSAVTGGGGIPLFIPSRTQPIAANGSGLVSPGSASWVAMFAEARWLLTNYPDNSIECMRALELGALPYYPIDGVSAQYGGVPWSETYLTTGQSGGAHLGPYGNSVFNTKESWPVIAAQENLIAWVRPREDGPLITGAAATAARLPGGLIGRVKIFGKAPDSISITSVDGFTAAVVGTNVEIYNSALSASPLTNAHYDCTITIVTGALTYACQKRLLVGASSTLPVDTTLFSAPATGFSISSASQPTLDTTRKFSLAARVTANAAMTGIQGIVLNTRSSALTFQHGGNNTWSLTARDANGNSVVNQRTAAITAGVANWVLFSVDNTGASPVVQGWLNDTSSLVSSTVLGDISLANNFFVGSFTGKGDRPFIGETMELWIAADKVDWSNVLNRRALFNVDKSPVALPSDGTIAGVQPIAWFRGQNADWWAAANYAPIGGAFLNYGYIYQTDHTGIPRWKS